MLLIYTNEPKPEELKSFEGAKGYLEKLDLGEMESEEMALHFNYVNKSHDLTDDFFENIIKSQKANYIKKYNKIFDSSYCKLTERLWELNQNQTLFFYDYLNEGKHADEIIYEIFLTKFKHEYSNEFSNEETHKALINPIRRSMQQCVELGKIEKTSTLRTLKELDMGIRSSNRLINVPDSTDISFGDIININNKRFIVLSQDCDSIIRNNYTRKIRYFHLVEIKTEIEDITEKMLRNFLGKINDNIVKDTLKKYGVDDTVIEKVIDKKYKDEDLSDDKINGLKYTSKISIIKKTVIPIKCIWLDMLVLRHYNREIILSEKNIEDSHEIRYAVKKYMETELKGLIERIGENTDAEVVKKILEFEFDGLSINCEPQYSGKKLIGFKIENVEREGRLDRLNAMSILKDVVENESRIPDIHTLLI